MGRSSGCCHVQDEVLLAVILRSGVPEENVLELARELMLSYGSFSGMAKASVDDLTRFPWMGRVKGKALKCSLELARRLAQEELPARLEIRRPEDAAALLREETRSEMWKHSGFCCLIPSIGCFGSHAACQGGA